jgi:hypothetical protein
MVFGFMVLPPLAARALARGMNAFLSLSSAVGLFIAILGFYLSVRLDLPLGPTDVAFGCAVIFAVYTLQLILRKSRASAAVWVALLLLGLGCSTQQPAALLNVRALRQSTVWLAPVRNTTGTELRLPGTNPFRSLAEMAGKLAPDYRPTVMELLRDALHSQLEGRKIHVALPESRDARLQGFSPQPPSAAQIAREAKLTGVILLTDIQRWDAGGGQLLNARVDFKLLRISDGAVVWERNVRRVVSTTGAGHLGQVSGDAIREIMRDIFGS